MKKTLAWILALVMSLSMMSCAFADDAVVVAQSMPTLNNPWYVLFANGSADMAKVLGVELSQSTNPGTAEWDPQAQMSIIENLIAKQPDVIEIDPTSTDGINAAIDEARSAGIKVVMSGTRVSTTVECSITADNLQGGLLCGQEMVRQLNGKGKIVVLEATPGRDVMQYRVDGFKSGIEGSELEIVAQQVANSERATAVTVMETILQAHPDIDGVWAANDEMALGAVEALRSLGLEKKVVVGGFDATNDAIASIQAGEMNFTADQIPYEEGVRAIAISFMVAKGMEIPETDIELPMTLVNELNIDSFVNEREANQKALIDTVIAEYGLADYVVK